MILMVLMGSPIYGISDFNIITEFPDIISSGKYINSSYSFDVYPKEINEILLYSSFITPDDLLLENNTPEILFFEIRLDNDVLMNCTTINDDQNYTLMCMESMKEGNHIVDVSILLSPAIVPGNYQIVFGISSDYVVKDIIPKNNDIKSRGNWQVIEKKVIENMTDIVNVTDNITDLNFTVHGDDTEYDNIFINTTLDIVHVIYDDRDYNWGNIIIFILSSIFVLLILVKMGEEGAKSC